MPAAAQLLPIEPPQPTRANRSENREPDDAGRDDFSNTLKQVDTETTEKPKDAPVTDRVASPANEGASAEQTTPTTSDAETSGAEDATESAAATSAPAGQHAQSAAQTGSTTATAATGAAIAQPVAGEVVKAAQTSLPVNLATAAGAAVPLIQTQAQAPAQTRSGPTGAALPADLQDVPETALARIDLAGQKAARASLQTAATGDAAGTLSAMASNASTKTATPGNATPDTSGLALMNAAKAAQPAQTAQTTRSPVMEMLAAQPQSGTGQETSQPITFNTPGGAAATATGGTTGAQAPSFAQQMAQTAAQPPAQQLGVSIARGVREGHDGIQIQLHPSELGRVEVRMELGHDGRIMAVVSAERSETLEHLRRDIDQLEKALADAGFGTDSNSFRFDDGEQQQAGEDGDASDWLNAGTGAEADLPAMAGRTLQLDSMRVDISV